MCLAVDMAVHGPILALGLVSQRLRGRRFAFGSVLAFGRPERALLSTSDVGYGAEKGLAP